jgi:hypothetical protein
MLDVEPWAELHREHFVRGASITELILAGLAQHDHRGAELGSPTGFVVLAARRSSTHVRKRSTSCCAVRVILLGPPGTDQTHLEIAHAIRVWIAGQSHHQIRDRMGRSARGNPCCTRGPRAEGRVASGTTGDNGTRSLLSKVGVEAMARIPGPVSLACPICLRGQLGVATA